MSHRFAAAFFAAFFLGALVWVVGLLKIGAMQVKAGENVLVVFPAGMHAGEASSRIVAAPARQFEPLGVANAWLVQASTGGLAESLEARGALLVLQAKGPIHFALGCTTNGPLPGRPGTPLVRGN